MAKAKSGGVAKAACAQALNGRPGPVKTGKPEADDKQFIFRVFGSRGYTLVSNSLLRHATMRMDTRALVALMLSYPQNYQFNFESIMNAMPPGCGAARVRGMIKDAIAHGFVVRVPVRRGGKFLCHLYYVGGDPDELRAALIEMNSPDGENRDVVKKEENPPLGENRDVAPRGENRDVVETAENSEISPLCDLPHVAEPHVAEPHAANRTLINNKNIYKPPLPPKGGGSLLIDEMDQQPWLSHVDDLFIRPLLRLMKVRAPDPIALLQEVRDELAEFSDRELQDAAHDLKLRFRSQFPSVANCWQAANAARDKNFKPLTIKREDPQWASWIAYWHSKNISTDRSERKGRMVVFRKWPPAPPLADPAPGAPGAALSADDAVDLFSDVETERTVQ